MISRIAIKNIGRNKQRSFVVIIAVTIGTLAGIFFSAWMQGMVTQKVENSIYTETGHLQLVMPQYLVTESLKDTLTGTSHIANVLQQYPEITHWSLHSSITAMAATSRSSAGITLVGIDSIQEKLTSNLYEKLIYGTYFTTQSSLPQVIIGEKLAETLRIKRYKIDEHSLSLLQEKELPTALCKALATLKGKRFITEKKLGQAIEEVIGSEQKTTYFLQIKKATSYFLNRAKITFTATNTLGEITYLTAQVAGIFKTSNTAFEASKVFMPRTTVAKAFGFLPTQGDHITLLLDKSLRPNDLQNVQSLKQELQKKLPHLLVQDLEQTAPDTYGMQMMNKSSVWLTLGIIYLALAFGITNTMTMAILERTRELGMLRAIGMQRKKIIRMIQLETLLLTSIGCVIGSVLALILVGITGHTGINLFGDSFEEFGLGAIIYPEITYTLFIGLALIVFVISLVASIIPIHKVLSTPTIEAMKSDETY